nr:hypothetical protein [Tanacetum cinerariifolium]
MLCSDKYPCLSAAEEVQKMICLFNKLHTVKGPEPMDIDSNSSSFLIPNSGVIVLEGHASESRWPITEMFLEGADSGNRFQGAHPCYITCKGNCGCYARVYSVWTPMDLGTICNNLDNGPKYMNSAEVIKEYWKAAGLRMEQTPIIAEHSSSRHNNRQRDYPLSPLANNFTHLLQNEIAMELAYGHGPFSKYPPMKPEFEKIARLFNGAAATYPDTVLMKRVDYVIKFVVPVVGEENLFVEAEIEELDDVTMNEDVEANVILEPEEGKETMIQEKDKVVDYKNCNIEVIPERYILRRWKRDLIPHALRRNTNRYGEKDKAIEKLTNEANFVVDECLFLLRKYEERLKQLVEKLENIKKEIQPKQNLVNNPQKASNKGGRRGERRKSRREIAMKAKAKRARKCGYCVEKTNKHTKTTCPLYPKYIAKLARIEVAAKQEKRTAASATEQEERNSDTIHIADKEQSSFLNSFAFSKKT